MIDMVHNALCCWTASQQSPIEDSLSPPDSPCSARSASECTCIHTLDSNEKRAVTTPIKMNGSKHRSIKAKSLRTQLRHTHCCYHHRLALAHLYAARDEKHIRLPSKQIQKKRMSSVSSARSWPPSAFANSGFSTSSNHQLASSGKSPSKRFSLPKYCYGRMTPSRTPSPPPQSAMVSAASSPTLMPASLPSPSSSLPSPVLASHFIPASSPSQSPSLSPLSISAVAPTTIPEHTASTSGHEGTTLTTVVSMPGSNAGSLLIHDKNSIPQIAHSNNEPLAMELSSSFSSASVSASPSVFSLRLDMSSTSRYMPPPTLTTSLATPTSPSLPTLPLSYSPPLGSLATSTHPYPSPSSSPSFGPTDFSSLSSGITSPEKSESTPFPASSISSAGLARLLEKSKQGLVSAGSRRPLILDLRPHPDFYPVSIRSSININLPTLLVRRYRRGGAVSSFTLESFITMPSDMDTYHQIQESWRNNVGSPIEPYDVIVLDQDMRAGSENYGRSATAAWTLLNVLERGGGGNCFGGAPVRLWYLEGGFESFQAWDASEEYLVRPGSTTSSTDAQTHDQDVEMTMAAPVETQTKPSLTISTSVPLAPKQKVRESLFSLNTKSLQRPAGVARSPAANLKPLTIPSASSSNPASPFPSQHLHQHDQQSKGSWLMVPSPSGAGAISPTMSVASNHSMELANSASTEHSFYWSAGASSLNGSNHFPLLAPPRLTLNTNLSPSTPVSQRDGDEGCLSSANGSLSLHIPLNSPCNDYQTRSRSASFASINSTHQQQDDDRCYQPNEHFNDSMAKDDESEDNGEQEISCILPNFLYLGPEIVNESQVAELDRLGVKRILNMATECEDLLVANRQGMEYHKIGVHDHIEADVSAGLLEAVEIIAMSSDSPVYVHCKAGKSRSVTATIAYLITHLHWPLNKAYQHVLKQRPCMCPNIGFVTELMRIEERTLGADKATGLCAA